MTTRTRTIRIQSFRLWALNRWFCFLHDRRESALERLQRAVVDAQDTLDITY